jgi:hypothetical protein
MEHLLSASTLAPSALFVWYVWADVWVLVRHFSESTPSYKGRFTKGRTRNLPNKNEPQTCV